MSASDGLRPHGQSGEPATPLTPSVSRETQPTEASLSPRQACHTAQVPPTPTSAPLKSNTASIHTNFPNLQQDISKGTAEDLERDVKIAIPTLEELGTIMDKVKESRHISRWMQDIVRLKEKAQPKRTLIGVAGSTGSGKSSVINAILDEERLVPTSCFRACTAVITELSYNYSDDPSELYRAEVEFITREDWANDLQHLKSDLIASNGEISRDGPTVDTEAGVAWAKCRAVYPRHTKEQLANIELDTLVNDQVVSAVLSTTKTLRGVAAGPFYSQLQLYVDSKDRLVEPDGKKPERRDRPSVESKEMEFWPLIKVVRIFTKADALSTGAVIVDLPGVQDSNAARTAVTNRYIENCSALWIVAPITRAVDDKTAQNLLGQSFRLQMKLDGNYSNVTFIASKSDEILVTEGVEAFGLAREAEDVSESIERSKSEEEEKRSVLSDLKKRRKVLDETATGLKTKVRELEELHKRLLSGEVVYSPSTSLQKRKRSSQESPSRKRLQLEYGSDSTSGDQHEDSSDTGEDEADEPSAKEPLTRDKLESMIKDLKSEKKTAREAKNELDSEVKVTKKALAQFGRDITRQKALIKAMCIEARNDRSRESIRQDFRQGVKELDAEDAERENEDLFDPDQDLRNYDKVAKSLPVFCVSSHAYQKLCHRLKRDGKAYGFSDAKATEIPQLREHTKFLTEANRVSNAKAFLNGVFQLLNSLYIWSVNRGSEYELTPEEEHAELAKAEAAVTQLSKDMDASVKRLVIDCDEILEKHIFNSFYSAAAKSTASASNTANDWGKGRDYGGLQYGTYKAACRREGTYSRREVDFNEALLMPLKTDLSVSWNTVFDRLIPRAMDSFSDFAGRLLDAFHSRIKGHLIGKVEPLNLDILQTQTHAYIQNIKGHAESTQEAIKAMDRQANRSFYPVIMAVMHEAYRACVNESGAGSYARMKEVMARHVGSNSRTMFIRSCEAAKNELRGMSKTVRAELGSAITMVMERLLDDCVTTICRRSVNEATETTRNEMQELISKVDARFQARQASIHDPMDTDESARPDARPASLHLDNQSGMDHDEPNQRATAPEATQADSHNAMDFGWAIQPATAVESLSTTT